MRARTAVQMVGLKLLLLSASMAVFAAAALPDPASASLADAAFGGMKLLHLILGTAGAGATLWFVERFDAKVLGAAISCGILCAVGGTPLLAHLYVHLWADVPRAALPGPAENALAIALGSGGIYIVPGLQRLWKRFWADPLAFFDWFRRGGPPPPKDPPTDPPGGGNP